MYLAIEGSSETCENEVKEQKSGFAGMLLGSVASTLLGNSLTGKGVRATRLGQAIIKAGKRAIRAGPEFLMPPDPFANFVIQSHYQNELKFNGDYSRDNLPRIKDGAYVIILDEQKSIGTHWIVLYVNGNFVICFDSFGVKYIKKFIGNKKNHNKHLKNTSLQFKNM